MGRARPGRDSGDDPVSDRRRPLGGDLDAEQLAAIGVTNQRETAVIWDRETGRLIYNAIVWQDRRTTDRIEDVAQTEKIEAIREKTGLEADAYFSATKAEWLLDNADPIETRTGGRPVARVGVDRRRRTVKRRREL